MAQPEIIDVNEQKRLNEAREAGIPWKKWGPYLSERQWGTVREDYSEDGAAWNFFTHDHARSRAYRWGEDGLAGISDDRQGLCFALALWNGKDPILKERLFGLTNSEGNEPWRVSRKTSAKSLLTGQLTEFTSTEVFQGSLPKTVHEIDSQDPTWAAGMMAAAGSAWG
jgi:hypothetical protein